MVVYALTMHVVAACVWVCAVVVVGRGPHVLCGGCRMPMRAHGRCRLRAICAWRVVPACVPLCASAELRGGNALVMTPALSVHRCWCGSVWYVSCAHSVAASYQHMYVAAASWRVQLPGSQAQSAHRTIMIELRTQPPALYAPLCVGVDFVSGACGGLVTRFGCVL